MFAELILHSGDLLDAQFEAEFVLWNMPLCALCAFYHRRKIESQWHNERLLWENGL